MVMAMVGVLSALAVQGVYLIQSYQITSSAAEFKAVTALARQTAITSGKAVELRLYRANAATAHYTGYRLHQAAETQGDEARALSKIRRLPEGVVMRASQAGSTVLAHAPETTEPGVAHFSQEGVKVIAFRPNGTLGLPADASIDQWTVTFAAANAAEAGNELPANFATVSFDVRLGTTEVYRP